MANLPMELMDFKLTEIAIPGSHDSAAYSITADSEIFLQELQHEVTVPCQLEYDAVSGRCMTSTVPRRRVLVTVLNCLRCAFLKVF